MKRIFIVLSFFVLATGCIKALDTGKPVTVDFSNQLPDHSVIKFKGEQFQGIFTFDSNAGTTQVQSLPNFGTYKIEWQLIPAAKSSCSIILWGDTDIMRTLEDTVTQSLPHQALDSLYFFDVQCR